MVKKPFDIVTVLALVVIAVVLVGEASVYAFGVNHYGADSAWDGDTVSYSLYSSGSDGYDVVAMTGTDRVSELRVFEDESFSSYLSEAREVLAVPGPSQDYVSREVVKMLDVRGLQGVAVVDSGGLYDYMVSTLSDPVGKGIVISSYSLPSQVYSGNSADLIFQWVEAGGRLYSISPEIGRFYTDSDGLHEVPSNLPLFFGKDDCVLHPDVRTSSTGYDAYGVYSALSLRSYNMANSVDLSGVPSCKSFGASYLGYSTAASLQRGSGSITVVTGAMQLEHFDDLTQIIASGIDYDTVIIGHDRGSIKGTITGIAGGCDSAYLYIGGINTVFARYSHV